MMQSMTSGHRAMVASAAIAACAAWCAMAGPQQPHDQSASNPDQAVQPNIVLIIADDLGVGEVGCYGQTKIRTPHVDALATQGMRFTQAYAGAPVCAPSRCAILTGKHMGHAAIRDNRELQPEGQQPLPALEITLAEVLQRRGYATACIGKWGLGPPRSEGDPLAQGFDFFFGYNCQRHAHSHYPTWLYRDRERIDLATDEAKAGKGAAYAPDLFRDEALAFMRMHRDEPFFLMFATTIPHVALQVPEDSLLEYAGAFEETPYDGRKGYMTHPKPRAAYAAMVTRMDRDIGAMLALFEELHASRETIVIFTSDNGPTYAGGADSTFFDSASGLRGLKGEVYEGGVRAPLIVRWPGRIAAGSESDFVVASWDLLPTLAAMAGAATPEDVDGIDFSAVMLEGATPTARPPLYWEYAGGGASGPSGFAQAVRFGQWKAVRRNVRGNPDAPVELYDLAVDPAESMNVAAAHPEVVARMLEIMGSRTPSTVAVWNP